MPNQKTHFIVGAVVDEGANFGIQSIEMAPRRLTLLESITSLVMANRSQELASLILCVCPRLRRQSNLPVTYGNLR